MPCKLKLLKTAHFTGRVTFLKEITSVLYNFVTNTVTEHEAIVKKL